MTKAIVFDMDGTIADLYNVTNWLDDLHAEKTRPYDIAPAIYADSLLNGVLQLLKTKGYKIIVTTWNCKGGSKEYHKAVKKAKINWLKAHNFPADEIHVVEFGTPKHHVTKDTADFQILVDDNAEVRKAWDKGATINANFDIISELMKLAQ